MYIAYYAYYTCILYAAAEQYLFTLFIAVNYVLISFAYHELLHGYLGRLLVRGWTNLLKLFL